MAGDPPNGAGTFAVVSLFSGGGGLDLGLEQAGFETRACVELERYACETLRRNQSADIGDGRRFLARAKIIEDDVCRVSGAELLRAAGLRRGEAALLAGGPPCVTFSIAGRRAGLAHKTGRLFEEYVRLLRAIRPKALIFENVKGLLSAADENGVSGGAFGRIFDAIAAEGYALSHLTVNMADYGVPQARERVIIIGRRGKRPPAFPPGTLRDPQRPRLGENGAPLAPWRDVQWALRGLPAAAPAGTKEPEVPNHVARAHTEDVIASFARTLPGKRNHRLRRDRLRWDRPSKVIRAQGKPKSDGSGQKHSSHQPLHPYEHRQLTPRECARIQTFPDWYWLPPQFVNAYRVVGDAVPPVFARILGESLLNELQQSPKAQRAGSEIRVVAA